jgi:glycosyltransferase involved in cell wall biosynthesis
MVIDDGSNSQNLLEFRLIKEQFKYDERFTFIEQSNQDVGYTRNLGARELDTEYLTFLDADDVYTSNYLELLNSAFSRGRDLVVSHFSFINEKFQGLILDEKESFGSYEPYGANVSLLWKRNLLGGANFGISRQLFTTLQGFDEAPKLTHHDWRFLAKAALKGHEVSVIPERTLLYRVIQHSMSRSRNPIESQLLILKEYKNLSEVDLQKLVESLLSSMVVNSHLDMSVNFVSSTERIVRKIQNIGLKLAPYGSKRWSVVLPIYRKLSK